MKVTFSLFCKEFQAKFCNQSLAPTLRHQTKSICINIDILHKQSSMVVCISTAEAIDVIYDIFTLGLSVSLPQVLNEGVLEEGETLD
jgi:hypothetical protein